MPTIQNQAFQMTRTNPLHMGNAPLSNPVQNPKNPQTAPRSSVRPQGKFESMVLGGLNSVNSNQIAVGEVQRKLITDPDSVDIHDVTTAMAKAQMSLNMAQTVIDRVVSGWNEISTTR